LNKRIADLEEKLQKLTPKNSSIPFSTQHPHAKEKPNPKKRKAKTRKKQGGQPGYPRTTRPLVPSKDCDEVKTLRPRQCRKCNARLKCKDPEPLRHQVIELPEIKPIVTEYQQHRLTCQCCRTQTCAPLPKDVPTGQCGPRLAAFTGLLMGHVRQSKRRAASFLGDLLNVPCSPAWTVKIQNRVNDALAQPYEELCSDLQNQEQLFVDESPTKKNKSKAWFWVAVAPWFAVFGIFLTHKRGALQALVGNYSGIIINGDKRLIGMCKELYNHRSWLWTFTEIEGIEPTNNTAERALRPAVIYRKLSFGTKIASGSRFIERILTVSETCRLQNRSPFQYLVAAMESHFSQQTPPSLLPTEETAPTKKAA
jgi:transposase